jgi:hypothetical protein
MTGASESTQSPLDFEHSALESSSISSLTKDGLESSKGFEGETKSGESHVSPYSTNLLCLAFLNSFSLQRPSIKRSRGKSVYLVLCNKIKMLREGHFII